MQIVNNLRLRKLLGFLLLVFAANLTIADEPQVTQTEFAEKAKAAAKMATDEGTVSFEGIDGWRFFRRELEHLASGGFRTKAGGVDPIEIITDYGTELKALGVQMIVVPIPAKARVYPEKFTAGADGKSLTPLSEFLKNLDDAGFATIDLENEFASRKAKAPDRLLFPKQDIHVSPYGCEVIAEIIAAKLAEEGLLKIGEEKDSFKISDEAMVANYQYLLEKEEQETLEMEKLPAREVLRDKSIVETDPDSPVLVMGGADLIIYHLDTLTDFEGGGIIDHLQARLGLAVDSEFSLGDGVSVPRIEIARRAFGDRTMWKKKKVLVWCFAEHQFGRDRWKAGIPADPK